MSKAKAVRRGGATAKEKAGISPDRPNQLSPSQVARRREAMRLPPAVGVEYGPFGRRVTNYAALDAVEDTTRVRGPRRETADATNRYRLASLRAESQRLDEENLISQAFLDRVFDVIVGDGTQVEPDTTDAAWNRQARELWDDWWWGQPEVRGLDCGGGLERMFLRHYVVDGDVLVIRDDKLGQIQLITADQIGGMRVGAVKDNVYNENGVLIDDLRRIVGFEVYPFTINGGLAMKGERMTDMSRLDFFAYRRRIDQTRGEPMGQASFPMLHRTNDICDGYAAATQLLSRIAVAVNRQGAAEGAFAASQPDTKDPGAQGSGTAAKRVLDLGMALMFFGEQGDKIEGIDRKSVGTDAVELLKFFLRMLGMPYGLSLEFTLMIWSDTNYASGKASLQQVQRNGRPLRNVLHRLYDRMYPWFIERATGEGLLPVHPEQNKYKLRFPPYPMLDPAKERESQASGIRDGLSSPQREVEAGADGADWRTVMRERSEAYVHVAGIVKELQSQGINVRIEDFIPRSTEVAYPAAQAAQPAPAAPPAEEPTQGDENA